MTNGDVVVLPLIPGPRIGLLRGLWATGFAILALGAAYAMWVGPYLHVLLVIAVGLWIIIGMWRVSVRVKSARSPSWIMGEASLELRDGADQLIKRYAWSSILRVERRVGIIAKRFPYQCVEITTESGETAMLAPVGDLTFDDLVGLIDMRRRNSITGDAT